MIERALIVGLGQIGCGYDVADPDLTRAQTHARALASHPAFSLVGGVDPDSQHRGRFSEAYGLPAWPTLETALAVTRPTVAVVATPTAAHAATVEQLLATDGVRSILCEKPLADTTIEAQRLVEVCRAHACQLVVNYMRRCEPGAIEVRNRIADGRIATPLKAVVWYSKGLIHNGSHFHNLLEFWCGRATDIRVLAPGRRLVSGDREPDVQVTYPSGSAVFLAAREECFSHYTIELVAPNGRLRYEQGGARIVWQAAIEDPDFDGYRMLAPMGEELPTGMHRSQWHVADHWARRLNGQASDICSGEDALRTLELLLQDDTAA